MNYEIPQFTWGATMSSYSTPAEYAKKKAKRKASRKASKASRKKRK